jgi:peptidoglycan/LPS O-acetylase OafA/YrhL
MKRLLFVDLMRTLSIALVLAIHLGCHYMTQPSAWPPLQVLWFEIWNNGANGVTMFFVISGFLITRLLASDTGGLFQPHFRHFYARRVARLFPLLIVICILGLGLNWAAPDAGSHRFNYCFQVPPSPSSLLMLGSIGCFCFNWFKLFFSELSIGQHWINLWSLSVEEQFYFLYPFALLLLKTKRNLTCFLGGIIVLSLSLSFILTFLLRQSFVLPEAIHPYASIATGCLAYLACDHFRDRLIRDQKICWILFGAGLFLAGFTYAHYYYKSDFSWIALGPSFFNLGIFLLLLGGVHLKFFESPKWFLFGLPGQLSYGIYLLHIMVLFFLWPLLAGKNDFAGFAILFAAATLVGWLSYRYFERPMNSKIREWLGVRVPAHE